MATIYAQAPPQQAQPQYQAQQAPQSQSNDPLFDALVRYITQGPGSSAVSSAQIQSILDDHSENRAYLESIVMPPQGDEIRIWHQHGMATGFVSTNMDSLTLHFNVKRSGNGPSIGFVVNFDGSAQGFYPPLVHMFNK